jgi:hypothetical protein
MGSVSHCSKSGERLQRSCFPFLEGTDLFRVTLAIESVSTQDIFSVCSHSERNAHHSPS